MNDFTIIYKNKKLSNREKVFKFREIAYKAWERKDYDKAIEFINHAMDFSEYLQDDEVLEWDLIRLYNEKEGVIC
jgi:hypothetical protein